MGYTKKQCRDMKQQHLGQKIQTRKEPKSKHKEKQPTSLAGQQTEKSAEKKEDTPL
jgi:hypothetical protein